MGFSPATLKTLRVNATGVTALASGTRVYGVHWVTPVAGGRVTISDGSTVMIDFDVPAVASAGYLNLQQGGVRFQTSVNVVTLSTNVLITLVYDPPQ